MFFLAKQKNGPNFTFKCFNSAQKLKGERDSDEQKSFPLNAERGKRQVKA